MLQLWQGVGHRRPESWKDDLHRDRAKNSHLCIPWAASLAILFAIRAKILRRFARNAKVHAAVKTLKFQSGGRILRDENLSNALCEVEE